MNWMDRIYNHTKTQNLLHRLHRPQYSLMQHTQVQKHSTGTHANEVDTEYNQHLLSYDMVFGKFENMPVLVFRNDNEKRVIIFVMMMLLDAFVAVAVVFSFVQRSVCML